VILETHTVAVLIDDLTGVIQGGILIDDDGRGFEDIDEEHADEESHEQRQELQMIEKFHNSLLMATENKPPRVEDSNTMNVWEYMEVPWFAALVSFLIGFGIAAMFRPLCNGADCLVVHGPPVKDVIDKVYQMGEKCVEFTTEVVECPVGDGEVVKTVQFVGTG
jgi:hypothetical protein